MDELFKRYFWIVNLAALALCAYLTAATANNFVAAAIDPDSGKKVKLATGPASTAKDDDAPGEWKSNPFCKDCVPPTPVAIAVAPVVPAIETEAEDEPPPADGSCPERARLVQFARDMLFYETQQQLKGDEDEDASSADPPTLAGVDPSGLDVKLVNTVASSAAEWSLATFEEGGELKVYRGRSDELVKGEARVEEILRKFVFVVRDGRCEYLALSGEPVKKRPRGAKKVTKGDKKKGIKKISDTEYLVDRAEIDATLANLNKVATDARIVPSFKNGKGNGFKLFSIRPGSIYSRIGVQNGDVIQKINGHALDSPEKALEVYQKLQDSEHITIDLLRRGKTKSMEYNIQ